MAKKKRKTATKGYLDTVFADALKESYDYVCAYHDCPYCGNYSLRFGGGCECAHFRNRRYLSGRWHPDNCAALCHDAHAFLEHQNGLEARFFEKLLGETRYEWLLERHQQTYRYPAWERWEMVQHYKAQRIKIERLRMDGEIGYCVLTPWD